MSQRVQTFEQILAKKNEFSTFCLETSSLNEKLTFQGLKYKMKTETEI